MTVRSLQGVSKLLIKFGFLLFLLGVLIVYFMANIRNRAAMNPRTIHSYDERKSMGSSGFGYLGMSFQSNQSSLLLVTMGRTGSTFTSAIISHHQDVFFTNEPLHGEEKDIYYDDISSKTKQNALDAVDAFLSCDFRKFDAKLLRSELFQNSKSTQDVYQCLHQKKSAYDYIACFISMMHRCAEKRLHFVKSIRYRGEWVKGALERNPHLKILFLVRDFRATLYSQSATFRTFQMSTEGEARAKTMCTVLERESRELQLLHRLYPGRIKIIRYEDGCMDPMAYAKSIYSFAGLRFSESTEIYVKNLTHSKKSEKVLLGSYEIERSDPVRAMNKWRLKADFDLIQKIDRVCKKAYAIFGYNSVETVKQLQSNSFLLVNNPKLPKSLYQPIAI